jgi:hypothetical protein
MGRQRRNVNSDLSRSENLYISLSLVKKKGAKRYIKS